MPKFRFDSRRLLLTALAVAALVLATTPLAALGTPTYIVYFDGEFGGTLVVENAPDMPEGACGLRVNEYDTLDWYWAEYGAYGTVEPMPDPFAGPPNSTTNPPGNSLYTLIEFTGPFGDDCGSDFVFNGPGTGEHPTWPNGTPSGGAALVFQTLPGGVEWLTESFTLWEPPGDDPGSQPDPEFPTVCEIIPEMCIEPGFVYEDPCNSSIIDCGDSTGTGIGALKAAEAVSTGIVVLESTIDVLDAELWSRGLDEVRYSLAWAQDAHTSVVELGDRVLAAMARVAEHPATRLELNALQVAIDLAEDGLISCNRALDQLEGKTATTLSARQKTTSTRSGSEDELARVVAACDAARSSFESVDDAVDRLLTWGAVRERR